MRVQLLKEHGGPENFGLADIPIPVVEPNQVLVRIVAASVNQIDIKIGRGLPVGPVLPAVLGTDMAGIVEAIGANVSEFKPGDRVFGMVGGVRGYGGTLAEFIAADARLLSPAPNSLSLHDAAALPLVAITAEEAIERVAPTRFDHVLVHGGTGGVGHLGVQIAKARGARVATTVATEEAAMLARNLGADETAIYDTEKVEDYADRLTQGKGFQVIFDTVGGHNLANSFAAAAQDGRIVTTNGRITLDISPMHAKALSLSVVFVMLPLLEHRGLERHGCRLREIATLVDAGQLKPLIDPARFTLETTPDAYRYLASGKARGKIVIDIAAES